ncbi:MAG: hypothetical protein LBE57_01460, partial [Methanosarcinales archaeon]|nr:hypothetical protein [Methanosarcinales archaeon]
MNFKKVIVLLIVLMFLTPSFAFAAESDSAGSESGNAASSQSNFENSERRNSDTFENSDSSLNASEFEQLDESEIFDNPSEWGDNLDLDDSMTSSTTSTGIPGIDIPSLTAIQSPDLNFANDAYLTSLFSGAAVYTYPIQVPAGINGFQPRVELIYNSQSVGGQYGWLGDGWS